MGVSIETCRALPKVELHAHLTGSITRPILQQIWDGRAAVDADFAERVPSPDIALADTCAGQSIESFFAHFNTYLYQVVSTLPALVTATRAILDAFAADGVVYLELRTTPRAFDGHTPEQTIRAVVEVIRQYNASHAEGMLVNLILSIDRVKHDASSATEVVNLALGLREEGLPVVGVDLCGDVNRPIDVSIFAPAFKCAKAHGLGVTIHFAEVPACSTRKELEEILSWNPDRLGHVIHVPDDLREVIRERGIGVELCLTCNVLAGMLPGPKGEEGAKGGMDDHHFGEWWSTADRERGSISLGTDDVGVFGSWASEEYRLASEHFGLDEGDLRRLSRMAMRKAFCPDEQRKEIIGMIDSR